MLYRMAMHIFYLFGVLHRFQSCMVISQWVVLWADETGTYSW